MKGLLIGILGIAVTFSMLAVPVNAAPELMATGKVGPYEGTFRGTVYGDRGSSAPLVMDLTHRGNQVEGKVSLGEGLYVNGGWCGNVNIPAVSTHVEGQTQRLNARRLVTSPSFDVGGFKLTVDFESNIARDGQTITAEAKVDLPWLCGRDPVLTGKAFRR
jgi:secreted trypsin-like serine protease